MPEVSDIMLKLEVIDTGCGMDENETARLFQPFSQANPQIHGKYGGTGLGLYITKSLVELMKGRIGMKSKKGSGTSFLVKVPAKAPLLENKSEGQSFKSMTHELSGHEKKMVINYFGGSELLRELQERWPNDKYYFRKRVEIEPHLESKHTTDGTLCSWIIDQSIITPQTQVSIELGKWSNRDLLVIVQELADFSPARRAWHSATTKVVFAKDAQGAMSIIETRHRELLASIKSKIGILIVDDDEFNRKLLSHFLSREGFTVLEAQNGKEGFEQYQKHSDIVKVVLMDNEMPILDGPSSTRQILAYAEMTGHKEVSVLGFTGDCSEETRQKQIAAGAKKLLTKPIKIETLLSEIQGEINFL
jgi:CheY-like chemotaxis protein